jgi:hypothetical protein
VSRILILGLALQLAQRTPLAPAETLLEPELLRTIERASVEGTPPRAITGANSTTGEIVLTCAAQQCEAVERAMNRLATAAIPRPLRTIRMMPRPESPPDGTKAIVMIAPSAGPRFQVLRGLWSTAGITDEVVEVIARHAVPDAHVRSYEYVDQPNWDAFGVGTTTIIPPADAGGLDRASFVVAASAYFLATLPNAGAEALLSHLTVGAHARLADDGRRAVAMMGAQQRASGDVLVLLGQAIDREQRRMRDLERYMPGPADPMLRSRIADMQKGITGVWTSLGITSSLFVPPAERLRGRAGEDRRIPTRAGGVDEDIFLPATLQTLPNARAIQEELFNFVDGKRSISDIRDAVSAEFGSIPLSAVVEHFERLAKSRIVSLR